MEVGVIIAAAGAGRRLGMGSKALVLLNGRTVLARVVELISSLDEVARVAVVGPPDRADLTRCEAEAARLEASAMIGSCTAATRPYPRTRPRPPIRAASRAETC